MEGTMIRLAIVLYVLSAGLVAFMSHGKAEAKPQSGTPDIVRGKATFVKLCAGCHGPGGKGDGYRMLGPAPADLTAIESQQKSDATLLRTIHDGKPNMPVWKYKLSKKESRDVLAYIRSLQEHP